MKFSSTSNYVYLSGGIMAAIFLDEETEQYYYQIVPLNCAGVENKQIDIGQCVGPFEDFTTVNREIDKLKENNENL